MLRLIRGCALVTLAAVVLIAALYGPFNPFHDQETVQELETWAVWYDFARTTALVASLTAGVLTLVTAWGARRRAWLMLLAVGLVLDAYGAILVNVLTLDLRSQGNALFFLQLGSAGTFLEWLALLACPVWPAVVALAYAMRFRAKETPQSLASPKVDTDALDLHYEPLRATEDMEERA